MGVLLPSPKVPCHSPFALPPVTANTQMSVNWVRGVTFVTAALPCNQKKQVLWYVAFTHILFFFFFFWFSCFAESFGKDLWKREPYPLTTVGGTIGVSAHLCLQPLTFCLLQFGHHLTKLSVLHQRHKGKRCNSVVDGAQCLRRKTGSS